jgi:GNAT superfamily N-acetyltransferase
MIELVLTKANRLMLARAFSTVPHVDLAIDCVVEGQMGTALVDDADKPAVFKIQSGQFVYFAGDVTSPNAPAALETLTPQVLLMPSAHGWLEAIQQRYGVQLIAFDRYSFSGEQLSLEHLGALCQTRSNYGIKRMDTRFAAQFWGQEHIIDWSGFDSPEDFGQRGLGFYAALEDAIIGAAYTQLVCSRGIEVSVYVMPRQRERGLGTLLSGHLVKACLERGQAAHWDAANLESSRLAQKLGYIPCGQYQAHYLDV